MPGAKVTLGDGAGVVIDMALLRVCWNWSSDDGVDGVVSQAVVASRIALSAAVEIG